MSSSVATSPTPFEMSSKQASSVASSPPPTSIDEREAKAESDEPIRPSRKSDKFEDLSVQQRYERLERVLKRSMVYADSLKKFMDDAKQKHRTQAAAQAAEGEEDTSDENSKKMLTFRQPALVTGAKMKDYQLEGVEWMMGLHQNGISGILADEMGLGKTLQTIAFNAHLRGIGLVKPFLVVCPLSVLHNWREEFRKFAPDIPVCVYHGKPEERAELRRTVLRPPKDDPNTMKMESSRAVVDEDEKTKAGDDDDYVPDPEDALNSKKGKRGRGRPKKAPAKRKTTAKEKEASTLNRKSGRANNASPTKPVAPAKKSKKVADEDMEVDSDADEDSPSKSRKFFEEDVGTQSANEFPVILTTYDILLRDRVHLQKFDYSYIVVDEGHRLKNMDCALMKEIKKLSSGGRVVLTGTPLHNNLAELWSLLNFILPDIFNDLEAFQEWFSVEDMDSTLSSEKASGIVHTLHGILKPFLLRRVKADVLNSNAWFEGKPDDGSFLPPKKEYVLWAPLTIRQRELYDTILSGHIRAYLVNQATKRKVGEQGEVEMGPRKLRSQQSGEKGRPRKKRKYDVDGDDDEYFERLENGMDEVAQQEEEEDLEEMARKHQLKSTMAKVNNLKLQNTVMQLRKVCSHPFLFDWPVNPRTMEPIIDEQLVRASGKMLVLDRLLGSLFEKGHKVLLFSQFVTMLDILEDWADTKGWHTCRIDGSTSAEERREQMNYFQTAGDAPDAPRLFLLSTRAGGLGVNLTAADTVVFYDQDWNPQMDVQAQDRAHRIGQTRPVLIFRLVSAHTIEERISQRATEKRKLEALVIAKGKCKFKAPAAAGKARRETMAEMAAEMMKLDADKIEIVSGIESEAEQVLSDKDLEVLLDRRKDVFRDRKKDWDGKGEEAGVVAAAAEIEAVEDERNTRFGVYEGHDDNGDNMLAGLMGE